MVAVLKPGHAGGSLPAMKPRVPGSQVAPNQKPLHTDRRTTAGHSKVPIAQATEGKLYRVRDKDWLAVWGDNLTWEAAHALKEKVISQRRSRTARVEDMEVQAPDWYGAELSVASAQDYESVVITPASAPSKPSFELANDASVTVPSAGVVRKIPVNHRLLVNGVAYPVPVSVAAGDIVQATLLDSELAKVHQAATTAVRQVTEKHPASAVRYRDVTATAQPRPNPNPPRDPTASRDPVYVRLTAPPAAPPMPPASPLKVATVLDGAPLLDGMLGDDDLSDLTTDLGGGASDADLEHARKQAQAQG